MKRLKAINIIAIIVGIAALGVGGFFTAKNLTKALDIVEYTGDNLTSKQVLINGDINVQEGAYDPLLDIKADSPVLIRTVEMVQWYKDEKGVRMVLSSSPIPSFVEGGNSYTNPEFPDDITSEVFYGKAITKDGELTVGENLLKPLSLNRFVYFNEPANRVKITDLPEDNGNRFNLIFVDGAYVTASDDWQLGEIRVSYEYVDTDSLKNMSFVGNLHTENGETVIDSNLEEPMIYNGTVTLKNIRNNVTGNMVPYYLLLGGGSLLIILGLILKRK